MRPKIVVGLMALLTPTMAACQVASSNGGADEAEYPNDTIELVVPYAAGGPTDANARILVKCMEQDLGETIVVKNVDGANGAMGIREVIGAKPDGNTLGMSAATGITLSPLLDDLGFGPDDVTPIGKLFATQMLLLGPGDSFKDGEEFLSAAENSNDQFNAGSSGVTSPKSVALQALRDKYGMKLETIPLGDQAGTVTGLLGGNVDVGAVEATDDIKPYIESGDFVALAAISSERIPWLPDTPTLDELGYPDATLPDNETVMFGPAGLPENVVSTLEDSMQGCMEDTEVAETIGKDYVMVPFQGSEETASWFQDAVETYKGIVE